MSRAEQPWGGGGGGYGGGGWKVPALMSSLKNFHDI